MPRTDVQPDPPVRPNPALATILVGIGLGGFFDGIVLHQVLQWHHLLSAHVRPDTVANLRINTFADGLFHALTWLFTLAGVVLLYRQLGDGASLRWRGLFGGLLAGWGGFNVVEGIINHHVLGLHHVRPGPDELLYDVGFLIWGGIMLVIGIGLLRPPPAPASARQQARSRQ
jgi:uncharacterized membrane protein